MEQVNPAHLNPPRDHERSDVSVRIVLIFAGTMVISALFIILFAVWLYGFLERYQKGAVPPTMFTSPASPPQELPPAPQLQISPQMDLEQFRAAEEARLNSYGWVDRQNGVVRIPIDRAMDLIAQQGLPVANPAAKPAPAAPKTGGQNAPAAR
jgi:hypothetical protein